MGGVRGGGGGRGGTAKRDHGIIAGYLDGGRVGLLTAAQVSAFFKQKQPKYLESQSGLYITHKFTFSIYKSSLS